MDFAIDPALFGVAGPSTSSTGRVRDVLSLLQQHEAAKTSTRVPLLSDSGSSEEEDDDEEDDEEEDSGSGDDSAASSEGGAEQSDEDEDDRSASRIQARDKGKGRAKEASGNQQTHFLSSLPPMPEPLPPSSAGETLPPLPPGMDPSHSALYAETDGETDYAYGGSRIQRSTGELGRLISAIRDTSTSTAPTTATSRGFLGQEWDRNMEQELEDLDLDERTIGGRSRRKARGRVAVGDMEPSPEVRNMLGSANLAYVQGKQKEAIDILNEVIRIEPATKAAWYTLSTIQEELGNMDKAIQLRIVVAHLTKSKSETWKELGTQSRELGLLEQAAYCFGEAIRCDRTDVEAIWDRASLLRETGKTRQASTWFAKLLKLQPHNPSILRELGPLYYELNEVPKAVQLYQAAYDHFRSLYPVPSPSAEELQGWSYVDFELLADFLRALKRYKEAGKVIVEGVRWLQGRIQEGPSWNSFADDREYDLERKWREGWQNHPQRWCEEAPVHPMDTGLRLRLGLARLYEGRTDEAKIHFDIIRQQDIVDIPDVYGEIADAYFDKGLWEEACEVYKEMAENQETNVAAVWVKIAQCQRNLDQLQEAVESYQAVIQNVPDDLDSRLALAEIYERLDMREEALELVNEVIATRRAVRDAGMEHSDESASEYAASDTEGQNERGILLSQSRKKRKSATRKRLDNAVRRRTMTQEERIDEERAVQEAFDNTLLRLQDIDKQMEEDKDPETGKTPELLHLEWLDSASHLLDTFRTTKALFPSDGKKRYFGSRKGYRRKQKGVQDHEEEENVDEQAAGIAERLQASLHDDETGNYEELDMHFEQNAYRGVSFDDWALLTVRYAIMLTRIDDKEEAQEVLRHMLTSSMMRQDGPRNQFLIFGLVACSLYCEDYEGALDDLRKVIALRKMESEPLRLHQAVCDSGLFALDAFLNNNLQKYLLRIIKLIDQRTLPNAGNAAEDKDDSGDEGDASTLQMNGTDFKPTKVNPYFLMPYGHIMACGKSYQSAIVYYLRAYDLYPNDPLVCLSLALAYTHRAMQRQTDNRHYQLAQAIAFLNGYRKHTENQQEVQYNVARVFHQLGIADLAVKHYEKVLEMVDEEKKVVDREVEGAERAMQKLDLSREAAYNLSSIYFTRGAPDLARQVVDKYLSL